MSNYNAIDLNKVLEKVSEFCGIADSKTFILNEEINFNPLVIKRKLQETKDASSLLKDGFSLSFDGIENVNGLLIDADKDVLLNGIQFSKILTFLNHSKRIKTILSKLDENNSIRNYSDSIYVDEQLIKDIDKVVDPSGDIKITASAYLNQIFVDIAKTDNDLRSAADSFMARHGASLQENSIYFRNNRVTFLMKNSDKNKYNGYAYGTSASGLATYIEPENFISLNNKKLSLEEDKEEECKRILRELTYKVGAKAEYLLMNLDSLIALDVIFAKAQYGYKNAGIIPELNPEHALEIKDVCHPLLDPKTAVSNSYNLKSPYQGIVISGTNTGGKTVGLKTIGLSVLMTYLGIPLIADKALIPLYNEVYIDIDDNQSIANALSTFSAHISNINDILNNANKDSLILIDELISGTDPKEAQAISLAILEQILDIKADFVITTHYDDLKEYAYDHENILLSAVGFDLDNLRPTYKYLENAVGASNAIEIAKRYFDDEKIIDKAKMFVELKKTKTNELLDKLATEIDENEKLKAKLEQLKKDYEEKDKTLREEINKFETEKAKLRAKYLEELNNYIDDIKAKAQEKIDNLSIENKKTVLPKLDELKENEFIKEDDKFEVGDNVKVGQGDQIGIINEINGDRVVVNINGLSIKTKLNNLTKMPKVKNKKVYKERLKIQKTAKELLLVGQRVEEALINLNNYLDSAYGSGLHSVKIIHGTGTGQLRTAIRNELKKNKTVKSFANGDQYDGGGNVTIVEFK